MSIPFPSKDNPDAAARAYFAEQEAKKYPMIGVGWHPLVKGLEQTLLVVDPNYTVAQIKEKFGGLRYYVNHDHSPRCSPDTHIPCIFHRFIDAAESASFHICESCGKDGQIHKNGGWYKTLCEGCRNG